MYRNKVKRERVFDGERFVAGEAASRTRNVRSFIVKFFGAYVNLIYKTQRVKHSFFN